MRVNIRFNTNYPQKSQYEWRVLYDGKEVLCNEVYCNVKTFTSSEFIEGQGLKHHISCEAETVELVDNMSFDLHPNICYTHIVTPKKIAHIK